MGKGSSKRQVLVQWEEGLSPDWDTIKGVYNLEDKVSVDGEYWYDEEQTNEVKDLVVNGKSLGPKGLLSHQRSERTLTD